MLKTINNGVYPTMVTPFTADNKIDYDAVERLLNWYAGKADGIFAVCQSSEMFFMSFDERLELMKFVVEHAPKGMSVVASGHTADSLDDQIEQAKAFIGTGIDAYVFIANRFAKAGEGDSVFLRNADCVTSRLSGVAFGVYECPYPYKRLLSSETLGELAKSGRFAFLKDTCCDPEIIRRKLAAVNGTGLKIFNANSSSILESLQDGAAGFSGVMANFHPELYRWLCQNFQKEPEKARHVQDFVGMASMAELQIYPVNAKYHLSLEGLGITTVTRSKEYAMTGNQRREIEQMRGMTALLKQYLGLE
ncbi:MAG: dihydrodipicolinate synthase family protein [Oscillospiraceae bacterium]|nr:dihydrodipicolinate synthase family protein [Oscillospiraceae bacterium]